MIHRHYRANGAPDLRRWWIECDGCRKHRLLYRAKGWLIPEELAMCTYCPLCLAVIAAHLIETALT